MTSSTNQGETSWQSNAIDLVSCGNAYRIMQIRHFMEMLQSGHIYLPTMDRWEDPCENMLRRALKFTNRGVASFQNLTRGFCALCFSMPPESDAMWRLYGRPKVLDVEDGSLSVRVEFRVGELFQALWDSVGPDQSRLFLWAGPVRYLPEAALRNEVLALVNKTNGSLGVGLLDHSNRAIAQTLFLKREAFDYEREVRVLVDPRFPGADVDTEGEGGPIGIRIRVPDPRTLIASVTLCPWLAEKYEPRVKKRIADAGWRGPVTRSNLYDTPLAILANGNWMG